MKVAVVGSRTLTVNVIEEYIPPETTEIVSGGAKGVDQCAKDFAQRKGLRFTELLPNYALYGRAAPLKRNDTIVEYADRVLVFWDGHSHGTAYVIKHCQKIGKPYNVIVVKQ